MIGMHYTFYEVYSEMKFFAHLLTMKEQLPDHALHFVSELIFCSLNRLENWRLTFPHILVQVAFSYF